MPYQGNGIFVRVYSWVVDAANGVFVDATRTDTDSDDIADGLSNCVTRDGQSPALDDIPMGGFKITGLAAGTAATHAVNYGQVFTNPTFAALTATGAINFAGGTVTANIITFRTMPPGTNTTDGATCAFVIQTAFSAALPAQPGGGTQYYLGSLAGVAGWNVFAPVEPNMVRVARTSNTILALADKQKFFDITSGTFTQTFTAAATLGDGWFVYVRNSGTGDITLDPNGGELIDGLTSYVMYPNECRKIQCSGTAFTSIVISPYFRVWTASGTWVKPPGYSGVAGRGWSGGSSGQRTNNGANPASGGAGGGCGDFRIPYSLLGATENVQIGAGGAAVTGVANGNVGGQSSFSSTKFVVYPGPSWLDGGSIRNGLTAAVGVGFEGQSTANTPNILGAVWGGGAPSNIGSAASGSSLYGGGAGGSVDAGGTLFTAGASEYAGAGGAASAAGNGVDGTAPAGGGGGTKTGTSSGAGARGEMWTWGI